MSTQSTSSILFTHTTPQRGFRLLELPPELVDLLSSKDAPILELKSTSTTTKREDISDPSTPDYVNICTPTQTYRVRQVQSSNSLHIIRPSDGGIRQQEMDLNIVGGEDQDDLNLVDTLTSIAKCGSTLELHMPVEGFSAVPSLGELLGLYDQPRNCGVRGEKGISSHGVDGKEREKIIRGIFADVPVSNAQCERGWIDICAFILLHDDIGEDPRSSCWRPSAGMKLEAWKRVVEGAVLQGIDLGKQFLVADLWKAVLDDDLDAPFPRPLFEAIVQRVCESSCSPGQVFSESGLKWASIDKSSCVRWVGETYLQAIAPTVNSSIHQDEFFNAWKDHLPEGWREDVSVSGLNETSYMHPEPNVICFASNASHQSIKKNIPVDASAATAAKKSRNWHELFKNQKRQKR